MTSQLTENLFHKAMVNIYEEAKRSCNYNATRFLEMLSNYGGVATAQRLLGSQAVQYGFTELWLCKRLDLTVEAHVLKPEYKELFTEQEQETARARLKEVGYSV